MYVDYLEYDKDMNVNSGRIHVLLYNKQNFIHQTFQQLVPLLSSLLS